jgi:hypothetical protein
MSIVLHDIGRINIQPAMAASLEFIQVLESREDHLLAGLLDLTRKEDFIEDGVDLGHKQGRASAMVSSSSHTSPGPLLHHQCNIHGGRVVPTL